MCIDWKYKRNSRSSVFLSAFLTPIASWKSIFSTALRYKNCFPAFFRLFAAGIFAMCSTNKCFSSEAFSFLKRIVFGGFPAFCCRFSLIVSEKYPFSTILFTTLLLIHAMCPVFIGSSLKPLSTSFQRFSPVIVNFLEQPSIFLTLFACASFIVYRPMLGGSAVFPPAFFAGGPLT